MEKVVSHKYILDRFKNGVRHFKGLDIEGDFTNIDLSGISFDNCFIASDFRYCNLSNSSFTNGNIKTSDFRHANLTNAKFTNLAVESSQFFGAKTDRIQFSDNWCYGQLVNETNFEKLFKTDY